jgi:hypothetical protein
MVNTNKDKIYRGAYVYYDQNREYSEETYEVFKHHADHSYTFQSEILSRVANGEFLKVKIIYHISKDYLPLTVVIDKNLGSQKVQEIYACNYHDQIMTYTFIADEKTDVVELGIPPKFHIASPAACTAFIFFHSKKFDVSGKNYYSVFTSDNMWEFENAPTQERLMVETPNGSSINIKSGDTVLTCNLYNIYKDGDVAKANPVSIYASKHLTIPYRILAPNKIKIEVRYLNYLEPSNATLI